MSKRVGNLLSSTLLVLGVVLALTSNHYVARVMGDAALGVAVLAPSPDSPEWQARVEARQLANRAFTLGMAATLGGILIGLYTALVNRGGSQGEGVDGTNYWIALTIVAVVVAIGASYVLGDDDFITAGQTVVLAVTAVALFLYARDTRKMAAHTARQLQIAEETNFQPLAKLAVMQPEMSWNDLQCPLRLEVLRYVPFVARVDLQLEINGELVPTGSDLYDAKEEWAIYSSFDYLPGRISEAIARKFPSEADFSAALMASGDIAAKISVTPLMLYRTSGSPKSKLTSAARSYLDMIVAPDGLTYRWMPDVQRSRYRPMKWSKDKVRDFVLETEIEAT